MRTTEGPSEKSRGRRRRPAWRLLRVVIAALVSAPLQAQAPAPNDSGRWTTLRDALVDAHPELAARREAVAAAEARARAAGLAGPLQLQAEVEEVPSGVNVLDAGSLRVEVGREFLGGQRVAALRAAAAADVTVARTELTAAGRRLAAAADRALVAAAGWSAIERRLAAEDNLLASAEASLRDRFSVGDARYVDVLRMRTERLRVQGERAAAVSAARAARTALASLAAGDSTRVSAVVAGLDGLTADALATALPPAPDIDSLVAASSAVLLADAGVSRAEAARRLTAAELRPRLQAYVGAQRFEGDGGHTLGPTVSASVTLPFTARRTNAAASEAATRDVSAAQATRRAALARLRADLIATRERYEAARTRLAVYDAALLRGARDEREGALASYRGGDLTLTDLLDFERSLSRAETDRLRSRIEAAEALAELYAAAAGEAPETTTVTARPTDR